MARAEFSTFMQPRFIAATLSYSLTSHFLLTCLGHAPETFVSLLQPLRYATYNPAFHIRLTFFLLSLLQP